MFVVTGFLSRRSILHLERRALLRPTLSTIIEPCRRNIGMPEPLLHLGDVGIVRERGRYMVGVPLRRATPSGEQQAESNNGCDYTYDQEPDRSVTGGAGEKF